jgi:hypothetical protein
MAYNGTHNSSTGYSLYYLLRGREIILPTTQSLKARLASEAKDTVIEPRLKKLRSSLQLAYKITRKNIRKTHAANKKYYDRKAETRDIKIGDVVYLFNPARPHCSRKFWNPWAGPFCVIVQMENKLNYCIKNQQGKEFAVHINRLQKASNQAVWKEKSKGPNRI